MLKIFKIESAKALIIPLIIVIGIIGIVIGGIYLYQRPEVIDEKPKAIPEEEIKVISNQLSADEAGQKILDFVNRMVSQGTTINLVDVVAERGLYRAMIDIEGKKINLYLTKDGAFLFPEAIDLEETLGEIEDKIIGNQLSADEAGQRMLDFVNKMLEPEEITASLLNIIDESGVYRVTIKILKETSQHHITKDGRLLFLEAINLEEERKRQKEEIKDKKFQTELELDPKRKIKIAKCLTENNAKFFGVHWCPACTRQKEIFGEAAKYLPYIECCERKATEKELTLCHQADIGSIPDWRFNFQTPDEVQHIGMIQIRRLVEISNCDF